LAAILTITLAIDRLWCCAAFLALDQALASTLREACGPPSP
jgi:hypothetical protein